MHALPANRHTDDTPGVPHMMTALIRAVPAAVTLLALTGCEVLGPSATPLFRTPVAGEEYRDWVWGALPDHAAGQDEIRDYHCGVKAWNFHVGSDLVLASFREMDAGVAVLAAARGEVIEAHDGEPDRNLTVEPGRPGNRVVVRHAGGTTSTYRHLRQGLAVRVGDAVDAGDLLGHVGSSGDSGWPHLTFEVRNAEGQPFDPWAGPCGNRRSAWVRQPDYPNRPTVLDAGTTDAPFLRSAIAERPADVTTFRPGDELTFWTHVANRPAGIFTLEVIPPTGSASNLFRVRNTAPSSATLLYGGRLGLPPDAEPGRWRLEYAVDTDPFVQLDFDVVDAGG